jgi:CTP:molybdopterin cytidylyltransferase MocA
MSTAVAILAAGRSSRLGQPKALVQWQGRSLLQRALDTACAVTPQVVIALGANGDALWRRLRLPADGADIARIDVADADDGLSASLRAVVAHADADAKVERLLVLLTDQYAVDETWLRALLALAAHHPGRMIASRYDDVRGVPAVFPRNAFAALAALRGDQGARALLRDETDPIDHPAPHPPGDVDVPTDIPRG